MYAVQAYEKSNFYTDDLKEAKEVYFEFCGQGVDVDLLVGEFGNFVNLNIKD